MGYTASEREHLKKVLPNPTPFTLSDLKKAVPPHCFERSYIRSFGHVVVDLTMAFIVFRLSYLISHPVVPIPLRYVLWPIYYWVQGCIFTGLWVLGHECGHGGFSDSRIVNDITGMILHTALLVPYYSWKHTHGVHHQNCCSMERDEVFVPMTEKDIDVDNPLRFTAPVRFFHVLIFLLLGWPLYLFVHATGQNYPTWTNHFNPYSACFGRKQRVGVVVTDLVLAFVLYGLYKLCLLYGTLWMFNVYFAPYMIVNCWLVVVTQLQHSDPSVPHYRGKEFTWLRGALATVDRDFGWVLNHMFHHIQDTHVVHHLFSYMPFYHAVEATKYVAPILGKYRLTDFKTPVASAVWSCYRDCIYVPSKGDIVFYRTPHNDYGKNRMQKRE